MGSIVEDLSQEINTALSPIGDNVDGKCSAREDRYHDADGSFDRSNRDLLNREFHGVIVARNPQLPINA